MQAAIDRGFTAVRETGNTLKVIPWKLASNGMVFTRGTDATAGTVGTTLAVAPLASGVVAAMKASQNKLRLISWTATSSGNMSPVPGGWSLPAFSFVQ